MYRAGTGDFFVLKLFAGTRHSFTMMIDCGGINASKETFPPLIDDLAAFTKRAGVSTVDLLVVTHQHDDHLNGFEKEAERFKTIQVKKVWLAWTEDDQDPQANELRRTEGRIKMALHTAANRLRAAMQEPAYRASLNSSSNGRNIYEAQAYFVNGLMELTMLNSVGIKSSPKGKAAAKPQAATGTMNTGIPTMRDLLESWNVIKPGTEVEYLQPGDLIENLEGALGLRFYILGPPRQREYMMMEDRHDEVFDKREKPSVDFSFLNLFMSETASTSLNEPFNDHFCQQEKPHDMEALYNEKDWQKIDHDWLFSSGSLALRLYKNINNTSLAFAIQFVASEKVLLFPGDSEMGCWLSWHDHLKWTVPVNGEPKVVTAEYLLNKTVFYKVSHHLSQNGTASRRGFGMMTSGDLTAMATLDFKKILSGWRNTMPNDFLGAGLIEKTKGKLYFAGDRSTILPAIQTDRVSVRQSYLTKLNTLNKKFDGKLFVDCSIKG